MAKNRPRRLPPEVLAEDLRILEAIKAIPNYNPSNPDYSVAALEAKYAEMVAAQQEEAQALAAVQSARADSALAQWEYENALLSAEDQVDAQYGKDSNEWQALGKKKKSEFSKRATKKKAGN
ncbi:MAG: hypothetical protein QOD32_476 [Pyrinomonadaceae bacterium]|jgi:hypothetical protein|nr:hypothetical protein [Pyrinomonadaceae bacterium]